MSINEGVINETPINEGPAAAGGDVATLALEIVLTNPEGSVQLRLRQILTAEGSATLALEQEMVLPTGVATLALRQDLYAEGVAELPLQQQLFDPADYLPDPSGTPLPSVRWQAIVMLDGADVSASLTGAIRIEAEEGAARVAQFVLKPAGGAIALTDWVGKAVSIDYALMDGEDIAAQWRLFSGVVDVPTYDPVARLTLFDCTDDLQGMLERTPREQLDSLIGGRWSRHIFSDDGDVWRYIQDRLSTVPAALDLDVHRAPHLTPWAAKASPDHVFDASAIEDNSLAISLASRRDLMNTVYINFDYRFTRGKARKRTLSWQHPLSFCSNSGAPNLRTASKPTRSMIEAAVRGTGWAFGGGTMDLLPPSGAVNCGAAQGGVQYWSISEKVRQEVIVGFQIRIAKQFDQDLTEKYAIKVWAPQSVAAVGEIAEEEAGSLRAEEADLEQESEVEAISSCGSDSAGAQSGQGAVPGSFSTVLKVPPDIDYIDLVGGSTPGFLMSNGDRFKDKTAAGDTTEDAAEAMEVLMFRALARIRSAHRDNTVSCVVPIQPYLDRRHTVAIETESLEATGKLRALAHVLDIETGRAVTEISIAVSRTESGGSAEDSELIAPNRPDFGDQEEPDPVQTAHFGGLDTHLGGVPGAPKCDPDWTGYIGNAIQSQVIVVGSQAPPGQQPVNFYPERFVIESEEIEAEARDPIEMPAEAVYTVSIPNDPLLMAA